MVRAAQGPPPRSFNAVTESTASARAHILSRVFMVDCASEGLSKKLFEDAFARGQERLRVHAQSIGKQVDSVGNEEADEVTTPFAMAAIVDLLFATVSKTRASSSLSSEYDTRVPFTRAFISQILTLRDREAALKAEEDMENEENEVGTCVELEALAAAGVGLASPFVIAKASNAMMFGLRLAVLYALQWDALKDLSKLQGSLALQYHASCLARMKHLDIPPLENNIVTQVEDGALRFMTFKGDSFGVREIALGVSSLIEEVINIINEVVAGSSYQAEDQEEILHEWCIMMRRGKLSNKFQVATVASGIGPAAGVAGRGFTLLALIMRHYVELQDVVEGEARIRTGRFFELWAKCRVNAMAIIQLTGQFDYRKSSRCAFLTDRLTNMANDQGGVDAASLCWQHCAYSHANMSLFQYENVQMGVTGITPGKTQHLEQVRVEYPGMLSNRSLVLVVLMGEMFGSTGAWLASTALRNMFQLKVQEDVLAHLESSVTACMKGYWGCPKGLDSTSLEKLTKKCGLPSKTTDIKAMLGRDLGSCSAAVAARVALALRATKGLGAPLVYRHFLEVFAQHNMVLLEERRVLAVCLKDEQTLRDCADVVRTMEEFVVHHVSIVANAVGAGHSPRTAANVYATQARVGSAGIATAAETNYGGAHVKLCSVLFNCVERSSDLGVPVVGQVAFRDLMESHGGDNDDEELKAQMLDKLRQALKNPTAQFTECQVKAAMKFVTNKKSTMVIMSAGGGKSMVFGLPTAMIDRTKTSQVVLYFAPLRALVEDMAQKFEHWFGKGFCCVWDSEAAYATVSAIRQGTLQAGGVKMILATVEDMLAPQRQPVLEALMHGGFVHTIVVSSFRVRDSLVW